MIKHISYSDIINKKPQGIVDFLNSQSKPQRKNVLLEDLMNIPYLKNPFSSSDFDTIFSRGVYLFYDENEVIRYIGSTNQGFLHRLMCHVNTYPQGGWGWNMILRKMGGERLGKSHNELSQKDHEYDWKIFQNYHLLLIDIKHHEADGNKLKKIERIIMKSYRDQPEQKLLNNRIGWLREHEWKMKLKELV